ncbi:glycoside hydrolase family 93 protein [Corynespora cassiicola Philippines]|uniref:Glycoside hydrolase family 93 protein n=1 Tax=Corynespora cassiicola Philippines TaxID=1448308 RepID=A0A2T2NHR2_CORCC|nr:glycoside hydrolase family 93 protein [Corynespora cassiicola Philippines]
MKLLSFLAALPFVSALPQQSAPTTFSRNVIYTPPDNYTDPRVLYARTAQLANGDLLATWENYSPEPPPVYFPIYKSSDRGYTWKEISRVEDQGFGWGLRYQPFLYVLPEPFGGYDAGTVLLSGSSIPTDLSLTQIDLYASTDSGVTWEFVSHIAAGGEARPNNGLTPVWEPFLMLYKDRMICYYSDQRENATYGQKMVHQTSTDLKTWGEVVDDVTYPTYTDRPGMPTVDLLPNGKYIMSYEYGGGPTNSNNYQFPVFYKIAEDPTKFGQEEGLPLVATDGTIPTGSPYVVWSPVGGENGTIIVSAHSGGQIYINTGLGSGPWTKVETPETNHYTRHLRVLDDPTKLLIMGAGQLPPSTTNKVQVTVMDISNL